MHNNFMTFHISDDASALIYRPVWGEPVAAQPATFASPLSLPALDKAGIDSACQFLGSLALAALNAINERVLEGYAILEPPDPAMKQVGISASPARPATTTMPHYAKVKISNLAVNVAMCDEFGTCNAGHSLPLVELHAVGARNACLVVGDIVLRTLQQLYPSVFNQHGNLMLPTGDFDEQ